VNSFKKPLDCRLIKQDYVKRINQIIFPNSINTLVHYIFTGFVKKMRRQNA